MEYITDVCKKHTKRIRKDFEMRNLGDYHDLYIQSNTLLWTDAFDNYRNVSLEIYELDPAHFLSAPD